MPSDSIADRSIDRFYPDPPFNANSSDNKSFKAPDSKESLAQIEAFDGTWSWNESGEQAFQDAPRSGNVAALTMLQAMRSFLGENDMMAYLSMMAVRRLCCTERSKAELSFAPLGVSRRVS